MTQSIPDHGFAADKDSIYLHNVAKIGNSPDNIIIFDNVLSAEDHEKMLAFCRQADFSQQVTDPKDQWYNRIVSPKQMSDEIFSLLNKVFSFAKDKINSEYDVSVDFVNPHQLSVVLWNPGDQMGRHVDDWAVHHYHIATIFYINDDYGGGEISFPEHGITIKPKSNSLIMFPGNNNYLHEVLQITRGQRYTSNMWFKFSGSKFEGNIN